MIIERRIENIEDVKDLIFDVPQNPENGRYRSAFLYRGMSDADFELKTSLMRNCGKKGPSLEGHLLDNFKKYVSIEDPTINESIWKAMIVGQHHGLPTRLLDWTHSSLVALHFATTEGNMDDLGKKDTAVWRIDARELNTLLPSRYQKTLNDKSTFVFSVEHLMKTVPTLSEYDNEMGEKSMVVVEPPSIDQRIANQYSFFTVVPQGITNINQFLIENTKNTIKYVIDKSLNWQIRDILDQLNMNERMIYPGIDGISKWLARHYFVKEEER